MPTPKEHAMNLSREKLRWLAERASAIAVPLIAIGALLVVLFVWSPREGSELATDDTWTCSMHPQVRSDKPGNCPICGMKLIPLSQLKSEQARIQQQAGLETEPVKHRELFKEIRTVGKLDYNERRVAYITARIDGRVDRVYADYTGIQVKANDHLVDIYSPELYSAQAELLRALEAFETAAGDKRFAAMNLDSARTKLRLLGILPEQIAQVEKDRKETTHLTIYAPIGGVVVEKNVREQQYVKEGDMLYRIAELDPIWLYLDIYEYDLGWIRYGQKVTVAVEAYPGQEFNGTVVFIEPFLNDQSRTVRVRVNLKNSDYKLKPAMYASATIHVRLRPDGTPEPTGLEGKFICPMHPEIVADEAGRCSLCGMPLERVPDLFPARPIVPGTPAADPDRPAGRVLAVRKSAVLDTGRRQIVYRRRKDGAYELVDLKLGPLAESTNEQGDVVSYYPVLGGLQAGDEVVVQGGFLLDSQRQIEGMPSLLYAEGRSAAALHAGHAMPQDAAKPSGENQH
jgi:Cu(I)/Ag(I) efflux system membrane fusion protein